MSQIISDDDIVLVRIILNIAIRSIISVLGIASNILNMAIFSSLGLKDSMSVGLFSLSFTDFLVTVFQLASGVCYTIDLLYPRNPIDVWSLGYIVFGFLISATYLISCWITAIISLERCFCVVSPFRVKRVFTRDRCVISVLIIYAISSLIHVAAFITHRLEWKGKVIKYTTDNSSSATVFTFTATFSEQTAFFDFVFDLSVGIGAICLGHFLTVACALLMGYSLEASSKVRQNNPGQTIVDPNQSHSKSLSALSERERRLVQVVVYVGVIHSVSSIPKIVTATVYHTIPGMNTGSQQNLSTTLWALISTIRSLCCMANFFVYVIINKTYRRRLYQMCRIPVKMK